MPQVAPDARVLDLLRYLDASPTPYHAVASGLTRLGAAGYRLLDERDEWRLSPGDRVAVVRGGGTLVALRVGAAAPSVAGFRLIGAHTDSPGFRLKPHAVRRSQGHVRLGVEVYGSPLLHTWLDRDLSIAGRVALADGSTHLVRLTGPCCRISSLAIHLAPQLATEGLKLNPETQALPTLALEELEEGALERALLAALRESSGLDLGPEALVAHDLALYDTQPAALGGLGGELVQSARLDNLASCHAALTALVGAPPGDPTIGVVLHDHEEVGSQSASGAGSLVLRSILERVARALPAAGRDPEARALSASFLVSADMAHAVHPAHADRHDAERPPRLGAGPVIKVNASQSYATDAPGAGAFERACRAAGVPTQRFASRADQRCGSTIGPLSAARLGVRTVDVGSPMLSMHSCREVAAAADVPRMIAALGAVLASAELAPPPAA